MNVRAVEDAHMATPLSAHRRSFATTTILATCVLVVLLVLMATLPFLLRSSTAHDHLPAWSIWLAIVLSTVVLTLLSAYAALIAVGGMIVLYRDSCEERGLPYSPARPRERIVGPMTAAIRRFIRPRARLRPGEMVEVRSLPEILATLDERGCLDGMPFMPEMAIYCGHRFPVHRRVDKVWEYAHGTGLRRVRDAVLLKTLRCDGQSHGGCQAACQLIWKEAWLRPPGAHVSKASGSRARARSGRIHAGLGRRRASLRLPDDRDRPGLDPALPTRPEPLLARSDGRQRQARSAPRRAQHQGVQRDAVAARRRAVARPEALGERFLTAPGTRLAARSVGAGEVQARHRVDAESQAPQPRPGIRHGHAVLLWRQLSSGGPRRPHRGRAHR